MNFHNKQTNKRMINVEIIYSSHSFFPRPTLDKITLKIRKLNLNDYENYHYDKDRLKEMCKYCSDLLLIKL